MSSRPMELFMKKGSAVNDVSPPKLCPPGTSERDHIWKQGLCRCNKLRVIRYNHLDLVWALNPTTSVPIRRREDAPRHTGKKDAPGEERLGTRNWTGPGKMLPWSLREAGDS